MDNHSKRVATDDIWDNVEIPHVVALRFWLMNVSETPDFRPGLLISLLRNRPKLAKTSEISPDPQSFNAQV